VHGRTDIGAAGYSIVAPMHANQTLEFGGGIRQLMVLEGEVSKLVLTLLCGILILLAVAGVFIQYVDRSWAQSSTAYIIFGAVFGGLLRLEYGEYAQRTLAAGITFDDNFYFQVLLPFVVLDAGMNLERENVNFYDNLTPILVFTIAGTFLSAMIIGFGTWGLGVLAEETWGAPVNGTLVFSDPIQSLKFGALISPTDPVAILSVLGSLGPLKDKALFSIIFGESVLNDAIGIVAFEVFEELDKTRDGNQSWQLQVLAACGWFVIICTASVLLGVVVGLLAARLTKIWPIVAGGAHYEVSVVFFSSYGAYVLGEALNEYSDSPVSTSAVTFLPLQR
jgi:sodium/hydrogen exchanger-like protein 6/7